MDFDDLFTTLNDEVNKILENNVHEIASQKDIIDNNNLFLNSSEINKGNFFNFYFIYILIF